MSTPFDSVGDDIQAGNADWSFDGRAARNFDEHVRRSVPFYDDSLELVGRLSDYFLANDSLVYDLGCATGELLQRLGRRHRRPGLRFIGLDRSADMIAVAREKNAADARIVCEQEELSQAVFEPADMITALYTLQFVRPAVRQTLFDRVYAALRWGGAFVLFEKVRAPDARFQDIMTGLYNDYKIDAGFSGEEILAKARSLKGVLEPFSTQGNYDLLHRAGFEDYLTVFKYVNFEGILAIK